MGKLPIPARLSLQEALDFTVKETGEPEDSVKTALALAFRHDQIQTRARCETYTGHDTQCPQHGVAWDRAEINWDANTFSTPSDKSHGPPRHVFTDVEVERRSLEQWLNQGNAEPTSVIDPPGESDQDKRGRPSKNDYEAFEDALNEHASKFGGDDWIAMKTNAKLAELTRKWMGKDPNISNDGIPGQRMAESRIATMRIEGRLPPKIFFSQ